MASCCRSHEGQEQIVIEAHASEPRGVGAVEDVNAESDATKLAPPPPHAVPVSVVDITLESMPKNASGEGPPPTPISIPCDARPEQTTGNGLPVPPVCADSLPKQKTQEEIEKLYAGADGQLDDIEKMMLKYDEDRSGHFSIAEVKSIVRDLEGQKKTSKHLGRALIGTVFVSLLVLGSMFALMILSIESTKENRTKGDTLVTNSGEPVRVANVESFNSVFDLPKVPIEQLQYLEFVSFNFATDPDDSDAVSAASFKLGGFLKAVNEDQLHLFTTTGAEITIGPGRTGFLVTSSGQNMTIVDDSEGRRLEENAWLECSGKSCEPRAAPEGRRLSMSGYIASFAWR